MDRELVWELLAHWYGNGWVVLLFYVSTVIIDLCLGIRGWQALCGPWLISTRLERWILAANLLVPFVALLVWTLVQRRRRLREKAAMERLLAESDELHAQWQGRLVLMRAANEAGDREAFDRLEAQVQADILRSEELRREMERMAQDLQRSP